MDNAGIAKRLLKPSEVQQFIPGETARSLAVERAARRDTPPYIKIGSRIYYDTDDLQAWIEAHKLVPSAPGVCH